MTVVAPAAPGRLGSAPPPEALLAFLDDLRRWRDGRRTELDELDRAALAAADPDEHTPDLTLAMGLWQAISDRYEQLLVVWGSGRVGPVERDRLTQLIWGRLDGNLGAGLAVSLVEALTLSDALAAQLRARLALDPVSAGVGERVVALRAAVERGRDLLPDAGGEGPAPAALDRLRERVDDLADRVGRGADVTGPLGQLEREVALAERDLIVAAARRRDLARDRERARAQVTALEAREAPLRELAERCRAAVVDPPRLAVPDVSNLGPVPEARGELDDYLQRLTRVAAAFGFAEEAYRRPLAERDELRGRLHAYGAMAQSRGRAEDDDLRRTWDEAHDRLNAVPCDLVAARDAVARYQDAVRVATGRVAPVPAFDPGPPTTAAVEPAGTEPPVVEPVAVAPTADGTIGVEPTADEPPDEPPANEPAREEPAVAPAAPVAGTVPDPVAVVGPPPDPTPA